MPRKWAILTLAFSFPTNFVFYNSKRVFTAELIAIMLSSAVLDAQNPDFTKCVIYADRLSCRFAIVGILVSDIILVHFIALVVGVLRFGLQVYRRTAHFVHLRNQLY
jgi:hypothetical protein